jgi:hypothetical protein
VHILYGGVRKRKKFQKEKKEISKVSFEKEREKTEKEKRKQWFQITYICSGTKTSQY